MITGSQGQCPWTPVIQGGEMYNYVEKDIDILDWETCLEDSEALLRDSDDIIIFFEIIHCWVPVCFPVGP